MADFDTGTKEKNTVNGPQEREQQSPTENISERKKSETRGKVLENEKEEEEGMKIILEDGFPTPCLNGHIGFLRHIKIEGNYAVAAGEDGKIYIWDIMKSIRCQTLAGHSDSVTGLALVNMDALTDPKLMPCASEKVIVSGSIDGTIKLWTLESQELKSFLTNNVITCLDVIKERVIVTGTDSGRLIARQVRNCNIVNSVDAHTQAVQHLTVGQNTQFFASAGARTSTFKVWIFNNNNFTLKYIFIREEQLKTIRCLSMYKGMLFIGDDTDSLKIINWRTENVTVIPSNEKKQSTIGLFVSSEYLISTSFAPSVSESILSIRRMPNFEYVCSVKCHMALAFCIACAKSNDGMKFVIGGSEMAVVKYVLQKDNLKSNDSTILEDSEANTTP